MDDQLLAQVQRAFWDGDRLRQMPARRAKRLVVLDQLAQRFEPGRTYTEAEVNRAPRGPLTLTSPCCAATSWTRPSSPGTAASTGERWLGRRVNRSDAPAVLGVEGRVFALPEGTRWSRVRHDLRPSGPHPRHPRRRRAGPALRPRCASSPRSQTWRERLAMPIVVLLDLGRRRRPSSPSCPARSSTTGWSAPASPRATPWRGTPSSVAGRPGWSSRSGSSWSPGSPSRATASAPTGSPSCSRCWRSWPASGPPPTSRVVGDAGSRSVWKDIDRLDELTDG